MPNLSSFFNPKSIAIVGASREEKKVGAIVTRNIIESGFGGDIFPVNPKAQEVQGYKCYPNFSSLPQTPDLAVIAIPAKFVLQSLQEINQKGTKNVVVFTAGFKEIGEEGKLIEQQLAEFGRQNQMNLLGPNCLGYVNNVVPINVTFAQAIKTLGPLRFVSQSGAIASSIFDWCESTGLGFSQFVTLGNKAVLTENDFLEHWLESSEVLPQLPDQKELSNVRPVGLYLESVSDGQKFIEVASKVSLQNPIFILKPGKSQAAAKAMQSHTGAIAGEDSVLQTAFTKAGIIRCQGMEDLFDMARAFAWENAPAGPKVAVVSNAGGPAVISADSIAEEGLELTQFDETTKQMIMEKLPREASALNPIDVLGDALAERYSDACEIVLNHSEVHSLIVILTPQLMTQIEATAELISRLSMNYGKPIVCCFIGGSHIQKGEAILNYHKIPSFRFPERAIKALATMWRWNKWRQTASSQQSVANNLFINQEKINAILQNAKTQNRQSLDPFEANEILKSADIPTPPTQTIGSIDEAKNFANQNQYPVVLKLASAKLLHKTESGGVIVNINSEQVLQEKLQNLWDKINQFDDEIKNSTQIQIQKQVDKGIEVIVGVKCDPNFGPVLMFGAGGTMAELIADRNLLLLPASFDEVKKLINDSKVSKLLNGFRGDEPYDTDKLADLMLKLGQIALQNETIAEIEINPVIVTHTDTWAVDGKVVLG
jgi:acetate---CoA ligase (ADP-forming)